MKKSETISALATPPGKSALAIIRLSGPEAFEIVSRSLMEKNLFKQAPARYVGLYTVVNVKNKDPVDLITAIKYAAPRSFTGENMVEIICHGGPRVVEEIAVALFSAGAKPAGRGAFSQRAYENGKIDLMRAEAIRGIIESTGDIDLACARKLYSKGLKNFSEWRTKLLELCKKVEADIEFEENVDEIEEKSIGKIEEFLKVIEKEIKKREKIKSVENFIPVIIAGPVNAGKSSLFNLLLGQNRNIVHSDPGTTRDLISERMWICGYQISLIDSAGIRDTNHEIEKEGIKRSRAEMEKAGIILWITDATEPLSDEEIKEIETVDRNKIICVINKTDLSHGNRKKEILENLKIETLAISIKENKNIGLLIEKTGLLIKAIHNSIEIPDLFLNQRHEEIGKILYNEMCCAKDSWKSPEIAAYHLRNGIQLLDEIFGKTDNEEVLNRIFSSFCIGK